MPAGFEAAGVVSTLADELADGEAYVTSYEVCFPARTSFGMGKRKPKANLTVTLDTGAVLSLKFPQAAGRFLNAKEIPLPLEKEEFFSTLASRERTACMRELVAALERRDLTRTEALKKLETLGFLPEYAEPCVEEAVARRFIDDARYAASFIERKKRQGWGRGRIERELKVRGVCADVLEGYPEAFFTEEDDLARAATLLAKKSVPEQRAYEKLVRFLMGKGFSYGTASQAVRAHLDEEER